MLHKNIPVGDVHVPYQWSYADSTARTAATGFVAGDVGKLARQVSDNSLWMLTDESPITWVQVGGSSAGLQATSEKNQANGYAGLDGSGKVAAAQLPSYVDDVLEVANYAALPVTGTAGIIYVTIDDNKTFRWTGSVYVEVSGAGGVAATPTTITVGATGYDYTTVSAAVASLANKSGFVEIVIQDQEIVESGSIELPASFVGGCRIRSATLVTLTGTSNGTITGSASNWTVPFNVSSSTGVAANDWLIAAMQIDGATQPERLAGFHKVTSVATGVVTVNSLSKYASVNSGNTTWANNRTMYVPKGRIRFTGTGPGIYVSRRYQHLHLQDLAILCDNTSNTNAGISVSSGGLVWTNKVGIAGFQYGILCGHHSEITLNVVALGPYTTADVHDVSLYCYNQGRAAITAGGLYVAGTTVAIVVRAMSRVSFWYSCPLTITGCDSGIQAFSMSNVDLSMVVADAMLSNTLGVSAAYSPALNTSGNSNSLIGQ